MSPRQEEEFELVLGNKQLLSLFFLVVVLFGVFFSFGYTVGYSRGENGRTREVAGAEPVEEPGKDVQLPDALFQNAPKPTTPSEAAKTEPGAKSEPDSPPTPVTKKEPAPQVAQASPSAEATKPRPVQEPPKRATPAPTKTSPPPKSSAPAKTTTPAKASPPARQPSAQAVTEATHLQVSAVRVKRDAEVYVEQLRAKGHPAAVSDQGDGWYRVVVGPFNSVSEAETYQKRLLAEGVKSLLRKR